MKDWWVWSSPDLVEWSLESIVNPKDSVKWSTPSEQDECWASFFNNNNNKKHCGLEGPCWSFTTHFGTQRRECAASHQHPPKFCYPLLLPWMLTCALQCGDVIYITWSTGHRCCLCQRHVLLLLVCWTRHYRRCDCWPLHWTVDGPAWETIVGSYLRTWRDVPWSMRLWGGRWFSLHYSRSVTVPSVRTLWLITLIITMTHHYDAGHVCSNAGVVVCTRRFGKKAPCSHRHVCVCVVWHCIYAVCVAPYIYSWKYIYSSGVYIFQNSVFLSNAKLI